MGNIFHPNGQPNAFQQSYSNYLVEISRFVMDVNLNAPGAISPQNQILGGLLKNKWVSDPTPINQDQWNGNIGAAYDQLGNAAGPGLNIQNIGNSFGGVKVNAIQPAGIQINTLNIGKK
jgi:hypothetical protein